MDWGFFLLDDRLSFWAALRDTQGEREKGGVGQEEGGDQEEGFWMKSSVGAKGSRAEERRRRSRR